MLFFQVEALIFTLKNKNPVNTEGVKHIQICEIIF